MYLVSIRSILYISNDCKWVDKYESSIQAHNDLSNELDMIFIHEKGEFIFPGDDENNPKRIW